MILTNRTHLFFFIVICLMTSVGMAQNPQSYIPTEYSIIPPSPEVASLMKYIDFPVSMFTGQPSISLPLYTIKSGALEIPISLSYHGGGIKASELPGIVGLGWNLNAGGCITRTVHGYPDEAPNCNKVHWGWSETNSITGVLNLAENERVNLRKYIIDREGINYALDEFHYALPTSVTHNYEDGKIDVANDIFTFNCLGLSGTFIFDPDTKQMILSTPCRVSFDPASKSVSNGSLPGSFIMYDDMMTRYEFDTMEDTRLVYQTHYTDSLYYISTWHLTKMISAHGDTILFKYSQPKPKDEFAGSVHSIIYKWNETPTNGETHTSVSIVHYYSRLLEEIESKSTKVCFQYDSTEKQLHKVLIYNQIPNSPPIKVYELTTEKLTRGKGYNNQIPYSIKGNFLKEIHENDPTTNRNICLYSFDYESRYNESNYLNARDEWGFYNGRFDGGFLTQLGANRDIDTVYSKNGVLKRITYATGGKTEFEWEQNTYSYIKGSRISMAGQQQEIESTTEHHLYARTEDNLSLFSRINVATDYFNTTYNINIGSQSTKKRIRINLRPFIKQLMDSRSALYHEQSPYYYQHSEAYDLMTKDARIELYNPQNQRVKTWFIDNYQCSKNEIDTMLYGSNGIGNYIIKLRYPYNWYLENSDLITASNIRNLLMNGGTENASGENGYVKIRVSTYSPAPQSFSKLWGGLRIKSIKAYSMDYLPIVKSFIYADSINGRYSSGTIRELPEYDSYYLEAYVGQEEDTFTGVVEHEYKINYSNGLFSTPCGCSRVEYPYVWEHFSDNSFIVRNEYDSQRVPDNLDIKDVYCDYVPAMSRIYSSKDFKRGNLIERKFYNNEQLYKKEHYDYNIRYNDTTPVFCSEFVKVLHLFLGFGEQDADYETCRYQLFPYNKTMTRASCYEYYSSDGILHNTDENAYRTERTFTYANNQSFNDAIWATYKLSESFMNSDSTIYTSYYTYINRNGFNLNMPETQVLVARRPHSSSSVIVSAKRFVYDNSNNLVATYRGRSGINADTYSLGEGLHAPSSLLATLNIPEFTYQYNDKGQLVEIRYKGIPLASYLWGYRGTYPIAEIRGIGYNDVFSALPNNLKPECLYNRYDITENDLASIRTFFPSNEVTTLTYNWLIGIGSITDTHGITTRFYYDGYGRLESVKDWNNYYIQKYDYHYVNQ